MCKYTGQYLYVCLQALIQSEAVPTAPVHLKPVQNPANAVPPLDQDRPDIALRDACTAVVLSAVKVIAVSTSPGSTHLVFAPHTCLWLGGLLAIMA